MKATIIRVSSEFANVADKFVFAEEYYTHDVNSRPGSAYDEEFEVELPQGCRLAENIFGEIGVLNEQGYVLTNIDKYGDMVCIFADYHNLIWAKIV